MTQSFLKEHFEYKDGNLIWIKPLSNRTVKGSIAGSSSSKYSHLYHRVAINKKRYSIHRLIWLYHHGNLPEQIDHINQDTLDNRIENLQSSNCKHNMKNKSRYKNNNTGIVGVHKFWRQCKNKFYYTATIGVDGRQITLKTSPDINKAIKARKEAEIKYDYSIYHGNNKVHNNNRK